MWVGREKEGNGESRDGGRRGKMEGGKEEAPGVSTIMRCSYLRSHSRCLNNNCVSSSSI